MSKLQTIQVEVNGQTFHVHTLKAGQQFLYFNGIQGVRDLYNRLDTLFGADAMPGAARVRFSPEDFSDCRDLIGAMADLSGEQLDDLSMPEWWGLLQAVVALDKDFLASATPKNLSSSSTKVE